MSAAKRSRREERAAAEEAAREAWIQRQLAKAPPPTWEQWAAANACLGIKVIPRESGGPSGQLPSRAVRARSVVQPTVPTPSAANPTRSPDRPINGEGCVMPKVSLSETAINLLEAANQGDLDLGDNAGLHRQALTYAVLAVAEELRQLRGAVSGVQEVLRDQNGIGAGDHMRWINDWLKDIAEKS
ncbi:hypothetical protein [Micromonospora sp. WMMD812]|uniref:hypothetical protein n=1 Tax=Micromonospora sp. WMMD812 TaxID=3015152 RepID=UPI00248BA241|nr:hypothetical protein [Micromonospora sp. WMMD812]WBB66909.1 hypothetical protein O7603_27910 [Micromonospora sp. WMMD812]